MDVSVVWKNSRPELEIRGRFEDRFAGCLDDDGVAGMHETIVAVDAAAR